jgi:hypothetical protein
MAPWRGSAYQGGVNPDKQERTTTTQRQAAPDKAGQQALPANTIMKEEAKSSKNNSVTSESQNSCKANSKFPITSEWIMVILTLIYVLFTGVYACASIATLRAIKRQADVMQRQTEVTETAAIAAKASAEAVRNAERAWILVHKITLESNEVRAETILSFGYCLKVFGKTPAKIIEVAGRFHTVGSRKSGDHTEPDLPIPPDYGHRTTITDIPDMGSILPPLHTFNMGVPFESPGLAWKEIAEIQAREKFLCCYGFIKYMDAFDPTKTRHTAFCYVYDSQKEGILASASTGNPLKPDDFRVGGPPEYNDAD